MRGGVGVECFDYSRKWMFCLFLENNARFIIAHMPFENVIRRRSKSAREEYVFY